MNENAKLIQSLYEAFARGDIGFILNRVANDTDWNASDSTEMPYHGHYSGRAEVSKFFEQIAAAVRVKSFEPDVYVTQGDEVMTTGRWSGVALKTGKSFTTAWAMRFLVKDGKIAYCRTYEDTAVTAAAFR